MRKTYIMILLTSVLLIGTGCSSKGVQKLSIQKALADTRSNNKIDPNITLLFGDSGNTGKFWVANKKTNSVNKEINESCNRAFTSAIITLQNRAKKEGKHSVIDIHSYYKKNKFSSSTEYECEAGAIMSGVTLRGKTK